MLDIYVVAKNVVALLGENFSVAEPSIKDVVESASQTGVVDVTSHPSCLPLMTLQILHSPVDKHLRLDGIVGHFPMVSPFPVAPSSKNTMVTFMMIAYIY